jgi:hypothetical protein
MAGATGLTVMFAMLIQCLVTIQDMLRQGAV